MSNVLVLGTGGQIARWVIRMLTDNEGVQLTLLQWNTRKLAGQIRRMEPARDRRLSWPLSQGCR
jgi:saccharopine dehydrogenase-like NADP-dependent oxidoreductase